MFIILTQSMVDKQLAYLLWIRMEHSLMVICSHICHKFILTQLAMSLSSLPDIFRQTHSAQIYHRKQGGSFQLHLNGPPTSRQSTNRPSSSQHGRHFLTIQLNKHRSVSSSAMRPKNSVMRDDNMKTNMSSRNKNQVTFKDRVQMMASSPVKKGSGQAVINISNVCYETSRKFNNRMVDLEQADSLKNNMETNLKETALAQIQLHECKRAFDEIQSSLRSFIGNAADDLTCFHSEFAEALRLCYSNLSKLRRETNDEMRGNKKELQKVASELAVCRSVLNDMALQGEQIASQTITIINQPVKQASLQSPRFDFEQISEIPRTSRGGTASINKRNRVGELAYNDKGRKSADWQIEQLRGIAFE